MANTPMQLMANGDIRPSRFVKIDASNAHKALEANANDRVVGISQDGTNRAPQSDLAITALAASQGQPFRMFGSGEECLLELGGAVSAGDRLKSDADGKGVAVASSGTTNQEYGAIAQTDGADGEKIRVSVETGVIRPALV